MTIEESVPNIEDNFWMEFIYFSTRLSLSVCKMNRKLERRFEFIVENKSEKCSIHCQEYSIWTIVVVPCHCGVFVALSDTPLVSSVKDRSHSP